LLNLLVNQAKSLGLQAGVVDCIALAVSYVKNILTIATCILILGESIYQGEEDEKIP